MLKINPNLKGNSSNAEKYAAFVEAVVTRRVVVALKPHDTLQYCSYYIKHRGALNAKHTFIGSIVKSSE